MTILITELFEGRESSEDAVFRASYTRRFRVLVDDHTIGPKTIRESLPVRPRDSYATATESDKYSYCVKRSVMQEGPGDSLSWIATVVYEPFNPKDWGAGETGDPVDAVMQVLWDSSRLDVPCQTDVEGKPILNKAGDPYVDPPVTRDGSRPTLVIERNERQFNDQWADDYRDAINIDSFWGKDPKTWKVAKITGARQSDPKHGWYYKVRYEFEYNPDTWVKDVVETGYRQLSDDGATQEQILIDSLPVTSPVTLDANGRYFKPENPDDVVRTKWDVYKERPFEFLNIQKPDDTYIPPDES